VLPGIGPVAGIALLLPATFSLHPASATICNAGVEFYPGGDPQLCPQRRPPPAHGAGPAADLRERAPDRPVRERPAPELPPRPATDLWLPALRGRPSRGTPAGWDADGVPARGSLRAAVAGTVPITDTCRGTGRGEILPTTGDVLQLSGIPLSWHG
jgi:hypothetical protein